jgi:hypothetical protein
MKDRGNKARITLAQIDGAITARFALQHPLELRIQPVGSSARSLTKLSRSRETSQEDEITYNCTAECCGGGCSVCLTKTGGPDQARLVPVDDDSQIKVLAQSNTLALEFMLRDSKGAVHGAYCIQVTAKLYGQESTQEFKISSLNPRDGKNEARGEGSGMPGHMWDQVEGGQAEAKGKGKGGATASVGPAAPFRGLGHDAHKTSHKRTRGANRVQQDRDQALLLVFKAVFLTAKEMLRVQCVSKSTLWHEAYRYCRYSGNCKQASVIALVSVAHSCSQLRHLNLERCSAVTDAGLCAIGEGCSGLQHLNLEGCEAVTDAGLRAIGEGCSGLQHLNLAYCRAATDAGLVAIGEGCSGLQLLNLEFCSAVTDAGLCAIGEGCSGLQLLDL